MAEPNESSVVRENRIRCAIWAAALSQVWLGLTGSHGRRWVKPACGPPSHCIGVRALSRLTWPARCQCRAFVDAEIEHLL